MHLLTLQTIENIHHKYAPSPKVFDLVWEHCRIVRDIALRLCETQQLSMDTSILEAGCLLHDIGVYPLFEAHGTLRPGAQYITHGIEGERILKAEGLPEPIWRFASHHTGVGLTVHDIQSQGLPLPVANYLAETPEEQLVLYADKFHSKTTPPCFNSFAWYKQHVAKFGSEKVTAFEALAAQFGIPDLPPLAEKYGYHIR